MMMNWDDGWQGHMDGAWGWFGAGMMILWMILLVAATITIIVWIVRSNRTDTERSQSPKEVVDMRFVKGEIDVDERDKMLGTLS